MSGASYYEIMRRDSEEYDACSFKWVCKNCDKSLCLRVVGVADFPSVYGQFKILAFTNNKDKKDHIMIVKGDIFIKKPC